MKKRHDLNGRQVEVKKAMSKNDMGKTCFSLTFSVILQSSILCQNWQFIEIIIETCRDVKLELLEHECTV